MNPCRRTIVVAIALTAVTHAAAIGATRVAVVATDPAVAPAVAIVESALSADNTVELVERQQVDKIAAEQGLSKSGVVTADAAVKTGQLLHTDLLAVVETGAGAEGASVVVFDAGTGLRLVDVASTASGEKLADAFTHAIAAAVAKHSVGAKLKTVCLQTVRNVDLPRDFDGVAQAAGLILTRRLTAASDVAVLERARLAQVNSERNLAGPNGDLLAATVAIELQLARAGDDALTATAVLLDAGQRRSLDPIQINGRRPDQIADALVPVLLQAVHANAAAPATDRVAEAHRFVREAMLRWQHKEIDVALDCAEAAYALAPNDRDSIVARAYGLLLCGCRLLFVGDYADPYRPTDMFMVNTRPPTDNITRSFDFVRDAEDCLLQAGPNPAPADPWDIGPLHSGHSTKLPDYFFRAAETLMQRYIAAIRAEMYERKINLGNPPRMELTPAQWQQFEQLKQHYRRLRLELEEPVARAMVKDSRSLLRYSFFLDDLLNDARCVWAADGAQWTQDWADAIRRNLALNAKVFAIVATQPDISNYQSSIPDGADPAQFFDMRNMEQAHSWAGEYFDYDWKMTDADWQRLVDVFKEMRAASQTARRRELANAMITFWTNHGSMYRSTKVESNRPTNPPHRQIVSPRMLKPGPTAPEPPAVGPGTAWPDSKVLIDLGPARSGEVHTVAFPVIGDDNRSAYALEVDAGKAARFLKFDLDTGHATTVCAVEGDRNNKILTRLSPPNIVEYRISAKIESGYYVYTYRGFGITLFPLNGALPVSIDPAELKLPDTYIQTCCVLGQTLFLAVGRTGQSGYMIACDLPSRSLRTLASSRSLDSTTTKPAASPFDNAAPMQILYMIADESRQRIVFFAGNSAWPSDLNGWWSYEPAKGAFKRLADVKISPNFYADNSSIWFARSKDHVDYHVEGQDRWSLDLKTDSIIKQPPVPQAVGYHGPGNDGDQRQPCLGPPLIQIGEWTWGNFGRFKLAEQMVNGRPRQSAEVQSFDLVRPVSCQWGNWPSDLAVIDDDHVIVGDRRALWMLHVPTNQPDAMTKLIQPRRPVYTPIEPAGPPPAGGQLPWTDVQTIYDVIRGINVSNQSIGNESYGRMLCPVIRDDTVYALAVGRYISRLIGFSLKDGSRKELAETSVNELQMLRWLNRGQQLAPSSADGYAAIDDHAYYFAAARRVVVLPLDGSRAKDLLVSDPGTVTFIRGLAVVDGKLFVATEVCDTEGEARYSTTHLWRFDLSDPKPASTRTDLALPNPRVHAPAQAPLGISLLRADPKRHRLLFFLNRRPKTDPGTDGLWACGPADQPQRLSQLPIWAATGQRLGESPCWAGEVAGDTWLTSTENGLVSIDLTTNEPTSLWQVEPTGGPKLDQRYHLNSPFALSGGWIWDGWFERVRRDGGDYQQLPPLRPIDMKGYGYRLSFIQALDDGRVVVADNCGMWVLPSSASK